MPYKKYPYYVVCFFALVVISGWEECECDSDEVCCWVNDQSNRYFSTRRNKCLYIIVDDKYCTRSDGSSDLSSGDQRLESRPHADGTSDKQPDTRPMDISGKKDISGIFDQFKNLDKTINLDKSHQTDKALLADKTVGADAAKPDAAKPDAAKPDAAKPDAAKPDAAKPDASVTGSLFSTVIGGIASDDARSLAYDPQGNLVVAGSFYSPTLTAGSTTLTSAGGKDIFILGLDPSGKVSWAKSFGGSGHDFVYDLVVDYQGNYFITGGFQGTLTLGSKTLVSAGGEDIFVAKFNSSGNLLWATSAGGTGNDKAYSMAVDYLGRVILSGVFQDMAAFGTTSLTSSGLDDIVLARLDSTGAWEAALAIGGTSSDAPRKVIVSDSTHIYLAGTITGPFTFDSKTITPQVYPEGVVLQFYNSLTQLVPVKAILTGTAYTRDMKLDSTNTVLTAGGSFGGTVQFGSTSLSASGASDGFLAQYDTSLVPKGAIAIGSTGMDMVHKVSSKGTVAGVFDSTLTIGGTTVTSKGKADVFLANFATLTTPKWLVSAGGTGNETLLDLIDSPLTGVSSAVSFQYASPVTIGTQTINPVGTTTSVVSTLDKNGMFK